MPAKPGYIKGNEIKIFNSKEVRKQQILDSVYNESELDKMMRNIDKKIAELEKKNNKTSSQELEALIRDVDNKIKEIEDSNK